MKLPDIDIDFPTAFDPTKVFPWARASLIKDGELRPHPCGIYPQRIPVDPVTQLAAIPYEQAEELGYIKLDALHINIYDHFSSREEITELLEIEPRWELLLDAAVQPKLFQLSKHGDVLNVVKPRSIEELADVLALIRPGKKQFLNLYKSQREATRRILYARDESGYSFKKAHAIAYSKVIQLQLHLIDAGLI